LTGIRAEEKEQEKKVEEDRKVKLNLKGRTEKGDCRIGSSDFVTSI
jgi:hypothetical protein